jgi:Na+/H+ antiporter NhaD/arsenite permease-like protein
MRLFIEKRRTDQKTALENLIMKEKVIGFIKKDTVLCVATTLAMVSAFFVKPTLNYVNYIDFRVLGILLSLMTVMAGLQRNGLFDMIGSSLLKRTKNTMQLSLVLVFLCFFFSMFITNDVSLITFVPFAMLTLRKCNQEKLLIPVIIVQTLAANLGSMLTPIGNPQNLYLYNLAEMKMSTFIGIIGPYTLASGILLLLSVAVVCRKKEKIEFTLEENNSDHEIEKERLHLRRKTHQKNAVYLILFLMSLLVVVRVLPYYVAFMVVFVTVFIMDRQVLKTVDYSLILTFIAFFIFTGNIGEIETIRNVLQEFVSGREVGVGIAASQVISNVPAALLLSGFTKDYAKLLVGVNIGGLGTLIASMASLISYKIYAHHYNEQKGKYFRWFTIANVGYLAVLLVVYGLIRWM